jgi:hypothetical protein
MKPPSPSPASAGDGRGGPSPPTWAQRHLAGWPVGLALVLSAFLSAALVVPRAVPPVELPLPRVERGEQRQLLEAERARSAAARVTPLPFEVRALGELVRRYGALPKNQPEHLITLGRQLREQVAEARRRHGPAPLLGLRALQGELFVQAMRQRDANGGGTGARAARELGGELASPGTHASWYGEDGFRGSDAELATLFRMRWNELAGVTREQPFAPTLNEWRAYYRFKLRYPARDAAASSALTNDLAALGLLDPDYPIDLARGVALYWQGAYDAAAGAFAAHLALHPDGPWTLRARNHLAACGAALAR